VILKINKDRRILNAKLHSAGHLLDCGVSKLGLENLHATKGFHFPD
jgi:Ser-tRNA(Ala) deacylase AlaX